MLYYTFQKEHSENGVKTKRLIAHEHPHMHCFEHALGHSCTPCSLITNRVVPSFVPHRLSPHHIHTDTLDVLPRCKHIPTSGYLSLLLPCMDTSFPTFSSLLKQMLAILGVFHDSHIRQSLSFPFTLSLHSILSSQCSSAPQLESI